jgi:hypothetical protein
MGTTDYRIASRGFLNLAEAAIVFARRAPCGSGGRLLPSDVVAMIQRSAETALE